jgi:hypothetical protein
MLPAVACCVLVGHALRVSLALSARGDGGPELILSPVATRSGWLATGLLVTSVLLVSILGRVARALWAGAGPPDRNPMRVAIVAGAALQAIVLTGLLVHVEDRLVRLAGLTLSEPRSEAETARWQAEIEKLAPGAGSRNRDGVKALSRAMTRDVLLVEVGGLALGAYCLALTGLSLVLAWRVPDERITTFAALAVVLAGTIGASVLASRTRGQARWLEERVQDARARPAQPPVPAPSPTPSRNEACASGSADRCIEAAKSANDAERVRLYTLACDRGTAEMCAHLAMLHMNGIGTAADETKAKRLLQRACDGGDRDSCGLFEKLKRAE